MSDILEASYGDESWRKISLRLFLEIYLPLILTIVVGGFGYVSKQLIMVLRSMRDQLQQHTVDIAKIKVRLWLHDDS